MLRVAEYGQIDRERLLEALFIMVAAETQRDILALLYFEGRKMLVKQRNGIVTGGRSS